MSSIMHLGEINGHLFKALLFEDDYCIIFRGIGGSSLSSKDIEIETSLSPFKLFSKKDRAKILYPQELKYISSYKKALKKLEKLKVLI